MIADVLADAHHRIAYYLQQYPTLYAPWLEDLERLMAEMARVQACVENPFFGLGPTEEDEHA